MVDSSNPLIVAECPTAPEIAALIAQRAHERFGQGGTGPGKADRLRARLDALVKLAHTMPSALISAQRKPILPLLVFGFGALLLAALALNLNLPRVEVASTLGVPETLQGLEALANLLTLFVLGGLFGAVKLRNSMATKHLRKLIRPIEQLAQQLYCLQMQKDFDRLCRPESDNTEASPKLNYSPLELYRYLKYVGEALEVLEQLAADLGHAAATEAGAELADDLAQRIRDLHHNVRVKYERIEDKLALTVPATITSTPDRAAAAPSGKAS